MLRTEQLSAVPATPGVYLLKDKRGKIIYIGKSANLKERLRSYTQEGTYPSRNALVRSVTDFDFIETESEVQALILEDNLIKLNKPKFNIRLKDDKKFPYLKITINESYPRIFPTRNLKNDGSILFGPYTNAKNLRRAVKTLQRIFKIRTCKKKLPLNKPDRPCLNYLMKRCLAPCQGNISSELYKERINRVVAFLRGRSAGIEDELINKMRDAANREDFETAALYRDELFALRDIVKRQEAVFTDIIARDIFGLARSDNTQGYAKSYALITLIKIREGKIIGKENYPFVLRAPAESEEILETLLRTIYLHTYDIPDEILLPCEFTNKELFIRWFLEERNRKVKIYYPKRGLEARLVKLANTNAEVGLCEIIPRPKLPQALLELQQYLNLKNPPHTIEGVDVSNIAGEYATGSIVVFKAGRPDKKSYRMFQIRTVLGPNDYAMLEEVLTRRVRRQLNENQTLPDLVLIDGGKGQLSVAARVYSQLENQPALLAFAKRTDTLYTVDGKEISIPAYSPALKLLKRIRNEAHRFAIRYHKKLRSRALSQSILDNIKGISKKRKAQLLAYFGSIDKIREASVAEIASLKGFNFELAKRIKDAVEKIS
ncbi:MAG: excinuclease ABC subunit UvrC [candidate division WOR-3 bacterium]|nr:excinuclease ABC subunit UvrC [candidate division WOR-3 bacterium]MCX7757723.1 excinuclease ABC subunit UvrC [candidate division WOR-3 bacterium]MDW7988174.1 excinuclease ABC subunit UvrC [candidate division WOR-3 bacterium]